MTAFFDTDGDLWQAIERERPDNIPSDMVQFLTFIHQPIAGETSGAECEPRFYLNLTRYTRMIAMSIGCDPVPVRRRAQY